MATLRFFQQVTPADFQGLALPEGGNAVTPVHTLHEYVLESADASTVVIFTSSPAHPFKYLHSGAFYVPTDGVIVSIEFEMNSAPFFTITGISVAFSQFGSFKTTFENGLHIIGSPFDDYLRGQAGNAVIRGGGGNDTIVAGPGSETLTGGPGNDTFHFNLKFGNDVITDFSPGDTITFSHRTFASFHAVETHAHLVGGHVVIEVSPTETIALKTVHHVHDLSPGDFLIL